MQRAKGSVATAIPIEFVTNREAAQLLRVTTRSVRKYVQKGLLQPYRLRANNRLRFKRTDVLGLVEPAQP